MARETPARLPEVLERHAAARDRRARHLVQLGLWPFATLGWPEQTEDLRRFYPNDLMIMGFDILFFWGARMIMMGLKFMKDVPFRELYIHALVRDAEKQKMSKTKGNVIDPLEVTDRYGTDAVRFALAISAAPGTDIAFSTDKVESYRAFANKIWNAGRFILMNLEKLPEPVQRQAGARRSSRSRGWVSTPSQGPKSLRWPTAGSSRGWRRSRGRSKKPSPPTAFTRRRSRSITSSGTSSATGIWNG